MCSSDLFPSHDMFVLALAVPLRIFFYPNLPPQFHTLAWCFFLCIDPQLYRDEAYFKQCEEYEEAMKWKEDHYWEFMIAVMVCVIHKKEEVKRITKEILQG